jgi:enamine deaminase RidA (YjgF/YER057c/UK114 family)
VDKASMSTGERSNRERRAVRGAGSSGRDRKNRSWRAIVVAIPADGQQESFVASDCCRRSGPTGRRRAAMTHVERVNPASLARPSGFSHAVVASGTTVHLAGQTALDASGQIVGAGVVEQFEQALGNLLTALREAGGSPEQLVSLTVYIVDMDDYRAHARGIGEVWKRLVGRDYPAMAGIGVARLWDAAALVEVQGMAVLPGASDHSRRRE